MLVDRGAERCGWNGCAVHVNEAWRYCQAFESLNALVVTRAWPSVMLSVRMSGPVLLSGRQLIGREREREALDRLLDGVRGGRGGVLVVHGEAGVGKTALLEYAVDTAREFQIARTSGVEAEMELPFAAVQQLCSPLLDLSDGLPEPQQEALGVAFGLITGPVPNPFLVGAGPALSPNATPSASCWGCGRRSISSRNGEHSC